MNANFVVELLYQSLDKNPDFLHLILINHLRHVNETTDHPRQDLKYHNFPVDRMNNNLQCSMVTRNRKITRLTQITAELKLEETVKIFGLNSIHPIPTSNQIKLRTLSSPLVVSKLQFNSTGNPRFDHDWGNITFYNTVSVLKN